MSSKKLTQKLWGTPRPKDFSWDDLITLMKHHGFVVKCQKGSHHTFTHTSGFKFKASKTHPGGVLKDYQVIAAKEALVSIGAFSEVES